MYEAYMFSDAPLLSLMYLMEEPFQSLIVACNCHREEVHFLAAGRKLNGCETAAISHRKAMRVCLQKLKQHCHWCIGIAAQVVEQEFVAPLRGSGRLQLCFKDTEEYPCYKAAAAWCPVPGWYGLKVTTVACCTVVKGQQAKVIQCADSICPVRCSGRDVTPGLWKGI